MTLKEIAQAAFEWFKDVGIEEDNVYFKHKKIEYSIYVHQPNTFTLIILTKDTAGAIEFKNLQDLFDSIILPVD